MLKYQLCEVLKSVLYLCTYKILTIIKTLNKKPFTQILKDIMYDTKIILKQHKTGKKN